MTYNLESFVLVVYNPFIFRNQDYHVTRLAKIYDAF